MSTITRLPSFRELAMNPHENNHDDRISSSYYNTNAYYSPPTHHSNQGKKRRQRTTKEQLLALSKLFQSNPLPTSQQRQELGAAIGMSPRAVQVWFQNKRQNLKKSQSGKSPLSPRSISPSGMGSLRNSPSPSLTSLPRTESPMSIDRSDQQLRPIYSQDVTLSDKLSQHRFINQRFNTSSPFGGSLQERSMSQSSTQSVNNSELPNISKSPSLDGPSGPVSLPSISNLVSQTSKPSFGNLVSLPSKPTLISPDPSNAGDHQECEIIKDNNSIAAAALLGLMNPV